MAANASPPVVPNFVVVPVLEMREIPPLGIEVVLAHTPALVDSTDPYFVRTLDYL